MTHRSILTSVLLSAFLATGCNNAADDERKANQSQIEANEKIAAAAKEAVRVSVAAQATADKSISAANAAFLKLREDYRHQTTINLASLDHKVDVLAANAAVAEASVKAQRDASLQQIRSMRSAFGADYGALESASASTWDDAKARVEKEWLDLKALVDKA
jgi:hypothetical protein